MKEWLNENLCNTLTETQRQLYQNFSQVLPNLSLPTGLAGWRETYLQQLTGWEILVKQSLQAETAWVEQWTSYATSGQAGTADPLSAWSRQMEGLLRQWLSLQAQLWDEFFQVLRHGGAALGSTTFEGDTEAAPAPAPTEARRIGAVAAATTAPADVGEVSTAPPSEPDDLTLISGIGAATAQKLQDAGIVSYRQLATLGAEEIERLEMALKRPGRIRREQWLEQAGELHRQKYRDKP